MAPLSFLSCSCFPIPPITPRSRRFLYVCAVFFFFLLMPCRSALFCRVAARRGHSVFVQWWHFAGRPVGFSEVSVQLGSERRFRSPLAAFVESGLKCGQVLRCARVSFPGISSNNVIVCKLGKFHPFVYFSSSLFRECLQNKHKHSLIVMSQRARSPH